MPVGLCAQTMTAIPFWRQHPYAPPNIAAFDDGVMVRALRKSVGGLDKYFLLRSTNSGASWSQVDTSYRLSFVDLVRSGELLFAVSLSQKPWISKDRGLTWEPLPLPPGHPDDASVGLYLGTDQKDHVVLYSRSNVWRLTRMSPWYGPTLSLPATIRDVEPITDGTLIIYADKVYVVLDKSSALKPWKDFEAELLIGNVNPIAKDGQLWMLHDESGDGYLLEGGYPVLVKRAFNADNPVFATYVDEDIVAHGITFFYRDRPDSVFSTHDVLPHGAPGTTLTSSFVAGGRRFLNYNHHVFEITSVKPLTLTERWFDSPPNPNFPQDRFRLWGTASGKLISNHTPQRMSFTTSIDGGLSWHAYWTDSVNWELSTHIATNPNGAVYLKQYTGTDECSVSVDQARTFSPYDGPMCDGRMSAYVFHDDGSVSYETGTRAYYRAASELEAFRELESVQGLECRIMSATAILRLRPKDLTQLEISADDGASWQSYAVLPIEEDKPMTFGGLIRISDHECLAVHYNGQAGRPSKAWLIDLTTAESRLVYEGTAWPNDALRTSDQSILIALSNRSILERLDDGTTRIYSDPVLGTNDATKDSWFRLLRIDGHTYMVDQYMTHLYRLGPSQNVTSAPASADKAGMAISVFPNPASSSITVSAEASLRRVVVFDLTGRTIVETEIAPNSDSTHVTLPLPNVPVGMYVLVADDHFGRGSAQPLYLVH